MSLTRFLQADAAIVKWEVVSELRNRGEVATFARAHAMCSDPPDQIREQTAQILAQLGASEALLRDQSAPILLELLPKGPSPSVRAAAAARFGHFKAYEEARRALIEAAKDPLFRGGFELAG
jgi:hypothetical protein